MRGNSSIAVWALLILALLIVFVGILWAMGLNSGRSGLFGEPGAVSDDLALNRTRQTDSRTTN